MSEHRSLLKSTSTIGTLTIISRIFGYLRERQIAALLGTTDMSDAYTTAYVIPNLLRRLVGEGAVSAAFIPTFTRYLTEDRKKDAFEFVNALLSVLTLFLAAVTVLGIVFSPEIVSLVAEGFRDSPAKLAATARLNRIMFPYLALISLSALAMGVLNSFHKFGPPAFAPVLLNLSVIGFSLAAGSFDEPAVALAIGVVVGGILQVAVQIPALYQTGWRLRWVWNLAHPGVRRVAKLMGPLVFGAGIVQINVLVGWKFASEIDGAMASIGFADRIMELVLGGYAIALSTAILPLLSRQAAENRMEEMRKSLNFAVRVILFVTVPATVGLIVLRTPIVQVLFETGRFDSQSTAQTARPLFFFALGLSVFALMKIIVPAFYALHDTRTPVYVALGSMAVNIVLNYAFFEPLGNGGPPAATSVAAAFSSVMLIGIFRRRHGSLGGTAISKSIARCAVASIAMGLAAYAAIQIPGFYAGGLLQRASALTLSIMASMAVYFGAAYILRAPELEEMGSIFARRARRA